MATLTSTRAGTTKPTPSAGWASQRQTTWGTIEVSANPAPADIFVMCKLPKGAIVLGGRLLGDRLSSGTSAGSASLGCNIGVDTSIFLPNGTSVSTASTSNALGTFGPLDPNTLATVKPESGINLALGGLLITDGPFLMQQDGNATITFSTSGTSFVTGTLTLEVDYYMGQLS